MTGRMSSEADSAAPLSRDDSSAPGSSRDDASAPTVLLGVTGCIAAYKACEIARALVRDGVRVKAVMTEAATRFLGPLTLRTLTGEPVATTLWDDPETAPVHHISLAEEADVFLIAPCTANVLAKLAQGRADDILTTTALATEAPLVIAPAMNVHMWRDEVTQANVAALRARGAVFVEPATGELACGEVGEGRLADIADILEAVRGELARTRELAGVRVLVTAGPTQEPIDPVRFLGNPASGKTGFLIAEEAARRGAYVTLVAGPTSLPDPFGVRCLRVRTALEMHEVAMAAYGQADVVVATAAVSDFRPAQAAAEKVKKDETPSAIELVRNPDILADMGAQKGSRLLVGFAAETGDILRYARKKLAEKNLDLVVANEVGEGRGFGTNTNTVTLVDADGESELPEMPKRALARELCDRIATLLETHAIEQREER